MSDFKNDFQNFLIELKTSSSPIQAKKAYLSIAKKYHPDSSPDNLQNSYNEYMMLVNKVYTEWKACGKIVTEKTGTDENNTKNNSKVYTVVMHVGVFGAREGSILKFTDYFEYLLKQGQDYYWQAHQILLKDWGMENENPEQTTYEALDLLFKAKQCYTKILKESPKRNNPDYVFMIQNEIEKVYIMNKNISRGLSNSCDSKELKLC